MQGSQSLLIVYNEANILHKSSRKHPECPERTLAIHDTIKNIIENPTKSKGINYYEIPETNNTEQIEKLIKDVHGEDYFEFVKEMWHEGIKKSEMFINVDTYFMKDTYFAAREAARSCVDAVDNLLSTKHKNAFAVVRPPGHHCGMKSQPHGFSFFNNLAIGINYAIKAGSKKKIAIVDWDVHHGEGTQKIFYERKDVLFISMHRFDNGKFFPHVKESGSEFVGGGDGKGFNVNLCWNLPQKGKNETYSREESVGDSEYIKAFSTIVLPILKEYNPEMIFVSCGFDSGDGDQIGNLKISNLGYTFMTEELMKFDKPIFLALEGGYNLEVLKWGSEAIIDALSKKVQNKIHEQIDNLKKSSQANKIGMEGIEKCRNNLEKYWKLQ